ncbi:hypothetical protein [Methylibium petroleiphilum]|uniref:hypothetical protein n=1 Tax=Methylibium petroleiphilum TaxID=105560 RepID=UPI001AC33F01|nr:hypothetical protein [Methylibium petroleiphilum]MBN9204673.1 hypothetical protein [Methylibium petroleiphilum]
MSGSASTSASRDNDPVTVRRALAHALAEYLEAPRVRDAVMLWCQQFQGRGALFLGLSRYCRQIADGFGLAGKEAELHLRIFRALQSDPRRLPDDPLSSQPFESTEPGSLPPGSVAPVAPRLGEGVAALQAFFAAIEAQLSRDLPVGLTPARVRRALIRHAASLPRPQQHAASLWWSGQVSTLDGDWPAGGHGTLLINVMYVALAELLGPVRADACFTQAVDRLEASGVPALTGIRGYL